MNRTCCQTTSLGDITVEKGTAVVCDILSLHHDKTVWGEDADEFRPERHGTKNLQQNLNFPLGCHFLNQSKFPFIKKEASTASKKLLALSALLFRIRSQNEESSTRHGFGQEAAKKASTASKNLLVLCVRPALSHKKSERRVVDPARIGEEAAKEASTASKKLLALSALLCKRRSVHRVKEVFGRKQSLKERRWGRVVVLKQQQTMSAVAPSARKGQKTGEGNVSHDEPDKHFMIAYETATQRISKESDRKQTPIGHTGLVNVGNSCFIAAFGLYGLTDHIGQQLDRGHYTSSVANFATKDKEWLNFNDAICKPCDAPSSNKNVYILHYQQIHADSGSDAEAADSGTSHDSESSGESGTDSEDQDGSDAEAAGSGTPHDSESELNGVPANRALIARRTKTDPTRKLLTQALHTTDGSDAEAADSGTSHDSESSGESGTDREEDQDGSDAEAAGSGTPHDSESSGESGTDREEDQE
ncbi:hypothetical protein niasHS_016760 [Heterodera schachtii]|uniref:Peptidase C19 ubiquitin carboxyl-terminal hydrolase domain-containing protein n=1 Tax=Heterodera schachtii TaxID=97005 RepID=A0ABD2HTD6_HETSC